MAIKKEAWSDNRDGSHWRGYDRQWRNLRAKKVKANPFCERCLRRGKHVSINIKTNGNYGVVHHKKPVEDYPDLRLDWGNLESLCFFCHEVEHGRIKLSGCDEDGFPLNPNHPWGRANNE